MNLELLEEGMRWRREEKPDWSKDFSSSTVYEKIYRERPDQLDEEWWRSQVNRLAKWRAMRSRKSGNTKDEITSRGRKLLPTLDKHYQSIKAKAGNAEPSLDNMQWRDIDPLFDVMGQIKQSSTPVFASKLSHFIFPRTFIVIDNQATGVFPYEILWCGLPAIWQNFQDKEEAKQMLAAEIRKHTPSICANYPFETKIAELWLIGYKARRNRMKTGEA